MDEEVAIKVEHVSKKYCKALKSSMLYGIKDIGRNMLGLSSHSDKLRKSEFWAVDDVSFEVRKGETLGIIGPNGSGKTTLLKMLNGIFWPDKGKIMVRGRVGALIAVGAGFHPLLTGRENIYINAAILGMTKEEVDEKFNDIIEFADIGDFIDVPVKFYSSGMFVRLGFAVAVHCEPDILLVDEVLSVGDLDFRRKCAKRMKKLKESDITIIFVTHDLGSLRNICDRAICLRSGKIVYSGDIDGAISEYMFTPIEMKLYRYQKDIQHQIKDVCIKDKNEKQVNVLYTGESYTFEINFEVNQKIDSPYFGIQIFDSTGSVVIGVNTKSSGFKIKHINGKGSVYLEFPVLNFIPGHYRLRVALHDSSMGIIDNIPDAAFFRVKSKNYTMGSIFSYHRWGIRYEQ